MFAIAICIAFVASAFVVGNQNPDPEKNMPFECGFDVFEDTRVNFDVRFYLVAILFMKGVKIVGPSLSGLYTNLVPIFTSVLAIIVLDEVFHIYHLISLIIIFLGIYIFDRKKI